jgi:hypothetical protein
MAGLSEYAGRQLWRDLFRKHSCSLREKLNVPGVLSGFRARFPIAAREGRSGRFSEPHGIFESSK